MIPSNAQRALNHINQLRARHSAAPLTWSPACATTAQAYAQQLLTSEFKHGMVYDANHHPVGQNLAWRSVPNWEAKEAVQLWYDEITKYDFRKGVFDKTTGHFTQMVWAKTKEVGIGIATSPRKTVVVANFSPPGNVRGRFLENVQPLS